MNRKSPVFQTPRVMKPPRTKMEIVKVKDDYQTHVSTSKFGPTLGETVHTSKVYDDTPYQPQYQPTSSLGKLGNKPNLKATPFTATRKLSFFDACSIKPQQVLSDPKALNRATATSFAAVAGKAQSECGEAVKIKSSSTSPTYLPKDLFKRLDKPIRKELQLSDASSDSASDSDGDEADDSQQSDRAGEDGNHRTTSGEGPSPNDIGDSMQQNQIDNSPPNGLRPPLMGSNVKTGYKANSFSEAYSSEAWVYYAGLMNDHMAKMESFIRAKAQNCEKTCLVKMAPGFTPTGSPEVFQMSISGSISLRRFWNSSNQNYTNLQPGKDFIVTPTAVPGVAEIWVPNESHRLWLFHQNKFSYHKLIIKNGKVENLGVKGSFYITSLRAPPQLYDILGAEYEHSSKYNKPIADMFKKLCPDAVDLHVEEVTKQVPCLDPSSLEWVVKDVPGHKRVSITCPPESTFKLPDGPMVLNLGDIGTRIVHTRRVLATTECQLCGERCWNGCRNRCSQCGLSGHIKDECPNKQLGDIRRSSQWVETSVKTALRTFSNPLYDDKEDLQQVLDNRVGDTTIQEHVSEVQAKIMILANLPKEARDEVEERQFDKADLLSVANASVELRSKAKASSKDVRKRSKINKRKKEAETLAEMKRQKDEAVRAVREQTMPINNSLFDAATQEDAEAAARLREQLGATIKVAEEGDIAAAVVDHHGREIPDTPVEIAEGESENVTASSTAVQSSDIAKDDHPKIDESSQPSWSAQVEDGESSEMTSQNIRLKLEDENSSQKNPKRAYETDSDPDIEAAKKLSRKEDLTDVKEVNMIIEEVAAKYLG